MTATPATSRSSAGITTEAATNNVTDYGVRKAVDNLPALRNTLSAINDNYLNVQQDIIETFIDRGQLGKLAQPTIAATGKRIPGLKLDNPRQLALMHALVRFSHIAAANSFTTAELYPSVLAALGPGADRYTLASLRYDLSKLRAKGLVEKLPRSRRYRLLPNGYTNTSPTAAMRGVSGVPLYAALEVHMDSIAAKLGVDRREYRFAPSFRSGRPAPERPGSA
jgi:hypothetical protein